MRFCYLIIGILIGCFVSLGCDLIEIKGEKVFQSKPIQNDMEEAVEIIGDVREIEQKGSIEAKSDEDCPCETCPCPVIDPETPIIEGVIEETDIDVGSVPSDSVISEPIPVLEGGIIQ